MVKVGRLLWLTSGNRESKPQEDWWFSENHKQRKSKVEGDRRHSFRTWSCQSIWISTRSDLPGQILWHHFNCPKSALSRTWQVGLSSIMLQGKLQNIFPTILLFCKVCLSPSQDTQWSKRCLTHWWFKYRRNSLTTWKCQFLFLEQRSQQTPAAAMTTPQKKGRLIPTSNVHYTTNHTPLDPNSRSHCSHSYPTWPRHSTSTQSWETMQ